MFKRSGNFGGSMQKSLLRSGLVCAIVLVAPVVTHADTISSDIPNGLFAPLTIIEDHSQCNAPGETAFKVEFETGSVSYRAQHMQSLQEAAVSANGVVTEDQPRCFVGQRSGTERIQVEVSCDGGGLRRSPFEARNLSQIDIIVSGSFIACQSPFAFEVLESTWRAQSNEPKGKSEVAGTVFQNPIQGCDNAEPVLGPRMYLDYVQPTMDGIPQGFRHRFPRDKPNVVSPAHPTYFRLVLNDMPVLLDESNVPFATVDTQIFLFPTNQGEGSCPAGRCVLPPFATNMLNVYHARQCP